MTYRLYVITGATGHLGNGLLWLLQQRKAPVKIRIMALPGEDVSALSPYQEIEIVRGDVCDYDSLISAFDGRSAGIQPQETAVIHCAGVVSIYKKDDGTARRVNVEGTANVIEACRVLGIGRLLYVSSVHALTEAAHGGVMREQSRMEPAKVVGLYAKTKAEASNLVLDAARNGLDAVVVHPAGIIGPLDPGCTHSTQLVLEYLKGGLRIAVPGGYNFVDVRDVAQGILSAVERGKSGQCYILSGRYISVKEILATLFDITGLHKCKLLVPMFLAKLAAPFSELHYRRIRKKPLFTGYSLYTLGANSNFDHSRATRELGFRPRPIRDSLADTVTYLKSHGRLGSRGLRRRKTENATA